MKRSWEVQGTPFDSVCPVCGKSIPKGSIYCLYCRAKVGTETEIKASSPQRLKPIQEVHITPKPVGSGPIPKDIMQTLIEVALQQPISLLLLASRCGSAAIEHVNYLAGRGLVRTQSGKGSATVSTTDRFADEFGMSREVKKMQAQLRADIKFGELEK